MEASVFLQCHDFTHRSLHAGSDFIRANRIKDERGYRRQLLYGEGMKLFQQEDLPFLPCSYLLWESPRRREVHGQKFANPLPSWKSPHQYQRLFRLIVVCPMKFTPSQKPIGQSGYRRSEQDLGERIWSREREWKDYLSGKGL